MNIVRITSPAIEPLTVAEIISHLRLDSTNLEPIPDAPTIALAGLGAGNVDNGVHRYRLSFLTSTGETDGGEITAPLSVVNKTTDGKVAISNIPIGGSTVTGRRIYRTAAGGSNYFLVATLADNTTTVYTDNVADASLGAGVQTTNSTSDPQLVSLIQTAREVTEEYLRRALITQSWRLTLPEFPHSDQILLPKPNLISVDTLQYRDFGGTWGDLDPLIYSVDTDHLPGRIIRNYTKLWPFTYPQVNSVKITYTCGYGASAASVPAPIKAAMKLLIADLYENREMINIGNIVNELPQYKRMLRLYRHEAF